MPLEHVPELNRGPSDEALAKREELAKAAATASKEYRKAKRQGSTRKDLPPMALAKLAEKVQREEARAAALEAKAKELKAEAKAASDAAVKLRAEFDAQLRGAVDYNKPDNPGSSSR